MTQRKGESDEDFKARRKVYYEAHKEERAAYRSAYYATHKEDEAAYNEAHKEERAAYRAAHKEDKVAYQRAHPENHLLKNYSKADKKYHRDNDLTPEFVRNMIYRPCHYCGGMAESGHNGLDRMNSSLGHLQSNCVPCCPTCNNKKHSKPYEVFMKEIQGNV